MDLKLTLEALFALPGIKYLTELDVIQPSPVAPTEDFHFPYVRIRITFLDSKERKVMTFEDRTLGWRVWPEIALDLYERVIHPAMRPMIEQSLHAQFIKIFQDSVYKKLNTDWALNIFDKEQNEDRRDALLRRAVWGRTDKVIPSSLYTPDNSYPVPPIPPPHG